MALSVYRSKSSVYRSKSASFSSPNSRSFVHQEILAAGESALVRSFSCGQFFTSGKRGETVESTQVRITNFISPVKRFRVNNKARIMAHDMGRLNEELPIRFRASRNNSRIMSDAPGITVFNLLLIVFICMCYLRSQYCYGEWKTGVISYKLKRSVIGQDKPLAEVVLLLENFSRSNESMVISFIGSTGVGKTLVANVIHDYFPWESNKHLHFFDANTKEILSRKTYASCGANLVIIDDLSARSVKKAKKMVEDAPLTKSRILFILIFHSHNLNDSEFILHGLNHSKVKIHNLVFNDLNHSQVKKCFKVELKRQGKNLTDSSLNMIVNEHMKYCNFSRSYLGCKNVMHEVSLLG